MISVEQILVLLLTSKVCRKCQTRKGLTGLYPLRRGSTELHAACKSCACAAHRNVSPEERARRNEVIRLRQLVNPRKVNRESHAKASRAWAARNRLKNREKVLAATRLWRKKNPDKVRAYKQKRMLEAEHKVLERYRTRVWWALKRNQKAAKTRELLGCSEAVLKQHLEALFVPGMTWENYGPVWHVDHKRPCASFDFSDAAQQRECFNFTNLQPLFAADNFSKGDKILC